MSGVTKPRASATVAKMLSALQDVKTFWRKALEKRDLRAVSWTLLLVGVVGEGVGQDDPLTQEITPGATFGSDRRLQTD